MKIGVVSSILTGGKLFFADFETPWCQFCVKMIEMSDLCYLGKSRLYHKNDIALTKFEQVCWSQEF